jgi:hypothetical protein
MYRVTRSPQRTSARTASDRVEEMEGEAFDMAGM